MNARVLIADDHKMFGEAVRTILEKETGITVVGVAENGAQTLKMVSSLLPDVLVLDIEMPDMSGLDICTQLAAQGNHVKIVALSAHVDRHFVRTMLKAGAAAYVPKSATRTELMKAVSAVMANQRYICPEVAHLLTDQGGKGGRNGNAPLGARECEVLQCLAGGMRSPEIALHMNISVSTVEVHRRNIMRKLNLHSVAELTKYAIREGLTAL